MVKNPKSRLPHLIKKSGMTLTEFAEKYNVAPVSVRRWISGESYPRLSILIDIAKENETNLSFILGRTDISTPITRYEPESKLYEALHITGISKKELGERANITSQVLSRYFSRPRYSRIAMYLRFADILNVSVDYLLGLSDFVNWEDILLLRNPFYYCKPGDCICIHSKSSRENSEVSGFCLIHTDGESVIFPTGTIVKMNDSIFEGVTVEIIRKAEMV